LSYLFHYKGSGPANFPYRAQIPQGRFAEDEYADACDRDRPLPGWATDLSKRWHVILTYLERRANKSRRIPTASFKERMRAVCSKLENQRLAEMLHLPDSPRLEQLRRMGPTSQWVIRVLRDYFPERTVAPYRSWDAGQCAWRHGMVDKKHYVTPLLRAVRRIAFELYPADSEQPRRIRKVDARRIGTLRVSRSARLGAELNAQTEARRNSK
jgi:hypothetical protein